jgi:dolichol-phosphate mannosyltransferase
MVDGRKTLIFVPTYNEAENAPALFAELEKLGVDADILFMDDSSTDGTGQLLDQLAIDHARLTVVHRPGKQGVGSAHLAGIRWAYDHGYDQLVTMDCDFTHPPSKIPEVLIESASDAFDVIVGSRYLRRNSLPDWNLYRKVLTRTGHVLTEKLLGMPYDATGGFRCYRLDRLPREAFDLVTSNGYSFFFESLHILHRNGFRIGQIPITLPNRTYGHSKMAFAEVRNSLNLLVTTKFKVMFNPEKFEIAARPAPGSIDPTKHDDQGWDAYWETQKTKAGGLVYDAIASIYRKWIIRPSLNAFVEKYFPPGGEVLHAGCGSGQVDLDIRNHVKITGLDISVKALDFYKKTNKDHCQVLHGSIFEIPLPAESMDGVYNLGVMEHFTEGEIRAILAEFHRVLRGGGRAILFWPPEFGLSVMFFKGLKAAFAAAGQPDKKFHPDEITRVRSRKHVTELLESAGFTVLQYYFGPKDVFTYSVIVAEKPTHRHDTVGGSGPVTAFARSSGAGAA